MNPKPINPKPQNNKKRNSRTLTLLRLDPRTPKANTLGAPSCTTAPRHPPSRWFAEAGGRGLASGDYNLAG